MKQTFETTERAIALVIDGSGFGFIFFDKNVAKNVENHCSTYIITYFSDDSRYHKIQHIFRVIICTKNFVKMFSRKNTDPSLKRAPPAVVVFHAAAKMRHRF